MGICHSKKSEDSQDKSIASIATPNQTQAGIESYTAITPSPSQNSHVTNTKQNIVQQNVKNSEPDVDKILNPEISISISDNDDKESSDNYLYNHDEHRNDQNQSSTPDYQDHSYQNNNDYYSYNETVRVNNEYGTTEG